MSRTRQSAEQRTSTAAGRAGTGPAQCTNCAVGRGGKPRQSRAGSLAEAAANIGIGYLLALLAQQVVLPLFGIHIGLAAHTGIATVITLLSLLRTYLIRRLFDHLAHMQHQEQQARRERLMQRLV